MLGSQHSPKKIQVFTRAACGGISFSLPIWGWAVNNAAQQLKISDFDDESIRPARVWSELPPIALHRRNWNKGGQMKSEDFESFTEGSVVAVKMFLASPHRGIGGRQVSVEELYDIGSHVGEYFGLSPWGSKFGYGRFQVISVNKD